MDRKTNGKKLKLIKAIFHASKGGQYSSVELIFADGRKNFLNNSMKRTLLEAGAVWLGFDDLPPLMITQGHQTLEITQCTNNADVLEVAKKYVEYLDGDAEYKDGQVLFAS